MITPWHFDSFHESEVLPNREHANAARYFFAHYTPSMCCPRSQMLQKSGNAFSVGFPGVFGAFLWV